MPCYTYKDREGGFETTVALRPLRRKKKPQRRAERAGAALSV